MIRSVGSPPESEPILLAPDEPDLPPRSSEDRSRWGSLLIPAAAAVLIGAFAAGYLLGREHEQPSMTSQTEATVPASATPTTAPFDPDAIPLEISAASWVIIGPGPGLPDGVTRFANPNEILDVAIDPEGFVWTAGPGGVTRWNPADGSRDRAPTAVAGVTAAEQVVIGWGGRAWFVSEGALWSNGAGRLGLVSLWGWGEWPPADELTVEAIAAGADGTLWVAALDGDRTVVVRSEPGTTTFTGDQWAARLPAAYAVSALYPADDGSLYVASHPWVILRIQDDTLTRVTPSRRVPASQAHDLVVAGGSVWVSSAGGDIHRWDGSSWQEHTIGESAVPWTLAVGPDGAVWAASLNAGSVAVARFDGETWDVERTPPGSHPEVSWPWWEQASISLAVHPDGTAWVGTADGLLRFDGEGWETFRSGAGLPLTGVHTVTVDGEGTVRVQGLSRTTGPHRMVNTGGVWEEAGDEEPPDYSFLQVGPDGTAWWVSGELVWHLQDGEWVALDLPAGIDEEFGPGAITACTAGLIPGREGRVWLVGGDVTAAYDGEQWTLHDTGPGPGCYEAAGLAEGPDGRLWAAGEAVYVFDGAGWSPVVEGLDVYALAATDDALWMAADGGAWRLHDGALARFLPGESVRTVAVGPDGLVWLGGSDLWRIEADTTDVHMAGFPVESLAVGPDGTVWAGGRHGLYRIDAASG